MSKFLFFGALLIAVVGCGTQGCVDAKPAAFTISPSDAPKPGAIFEVHFKEPTTHNPGWIVSKGGNAVYGLGEQFGGQPPSAHPIEGSSYNFSSVAVGGPTATLIWPKELDHGTYELCNADSDDLCANVTID